MTSLCEGIYKVFGLKSKTLFLQLLFHFAFQGIVPLSWLLCPVVGLSLISKSIWWLNSSVPHAHHLPAPQVDQGTGLLSSTYWVLLSGKQLECVASPLLVFQFWNWNINYDWNIKLFTYLTFPFLNFQLLNYRNWSCSSLILFSVWYTFLFRKTVFIKLN